MAQLPAIKNKELENGIILNVSKFLIEGFSEWLPSMILLSMTS